MPKNQRSGDRKAQVAKAGKRSGNQTYPAPISSERRAAKEQGEQQFSSRQQLTVQREVPWIFYDKALGGFFQGTKKLTANVEHVFDPSRGRVVYSPSFKEKPGK